MGKTDSQKEWFIEELQKDYLTKCSLFDELRYFCKRQIFVKLIFSNKCDGQADGWTYGHQGRPQGGNGAVAPQSISALPPKFSKKIN